MEDAVKKLEHLISMFADFLIPILIGHAINIYYDDQSVVNNTMLVKLKLNKNSIVVAYYYLKCTKS